MCVGILFVLSYFVVGASAQTRSVTVSPAIFNVGETATMMCTYTLVPGDVLAGLSWYKADASGNRIEPQLVYIASTVNGRYRLSSNNRDLIITNVEVSDAGNYLCRITVTISFDTADGVGMLSVNYINGSLAIAGNSYTTAQNVVITCSGNVDGNPVPDINLYRDTTIIKKQTTLPLTYTIPTVSENDNGNYRCEASNTAGTVMSNSVKLDYYLTGTVTISSTSNDTTIVFNCSGSVDGNPSPEIILYKDGDIILQQSTLPLIYTISSPTESDAGHYTCGANNTAFSTRSSVLELYKPILEEDTVGPGENYVITFDVVTNPQQVSYVWSIDGVVDQDANSAIFTFTASEDVGTVHEITVIATNLIGSTSKTMRITVSATNIESTTNSAKITMPSTETTVGPSNSNRGLVIGMLFVGIIIGAVGFYIGQIIYNKIRKKSLSEKQNTDKGKQDTYMDYVGDTGGQNQTYQDLQHKVEESAYVNVKARNKKKGKV